jgi:hypothetical protein
MKTINDPLGQMKSHFSLRQECYRKDIERAFGVRQSRFAIVRTPLSLGFKSRYER